MNFELKDNAITSLFSGMSLCGTLSRQIASALARAVSKSFFVERYKLAKTNDMKNNAIYLTYFIWANCLFCLANKALQRYNKLMKYPTLQNQNL